MSRRATDVLRAVDALACEDTRRTRILLDRYDIPRPTRILSYREHREEQAGRTIVALWEAGQRVALCSDGGYPGISDPGYRLIGLAHEHGVPVEVIPGPSAVPVALLLSGLPTSSYCFKGFAPRKAGPLRRFYADDAAAPHTLIVFESPFRVAANLRGALEALGDRRAAVCVELTKLHEQVHRGYLTELIEQLAETRIKGEVCLVIAGNHPKFQRAPGSVTPPMHPRAHL